MVHAPSETSGPLHETPAQIRVIFNTFLTIKAGERTDGAVLCDAGNTPDCAISAFIGIHGQNVFKITRIAAGVSFHGYRELQLKYNDEDGVIKKQKWLMNLQRTSRDFMNDDSYLCATLYTVSGVGELYQRRSSLL